MNETQWIQTIARKFSKRAPKLKAGIGDDCSIIRLGNKEELFTCDALIEGTHFRRAWAPWWQWGKKLSGAALSDIAAMGGRPRWAWLQLELPKPFSSRAAHDFLRGLQSNLKKYGALLIGGNTCRSRQFAATLMVQGERPRGVKMLRRDARPGDLVWLSGPVGWAATGLKMLLDSRFRGNDKRYLRAFLNPHPPLALGQWLAKHKIANACIDVSDGLLKDLGEIARQSRVCILLEAERIPFRPLETALTGGEDYVLAFTAPPRFASRLRQKKGIIHIGRVAKGKPNVAVYSTRGKVLSFRRQGFEHTF